MVAAQSVDAALRRVGKDIFFQTGLANFLGAVLFLCERLARRLVFDEFNAKKKTEAANIADVRMRPQRCKGATQILSDRIDAIKKFVRFEKVENSVSRRRGNWVRLIRESVHEGARATLECFGDAPGNENRAERRVTAGDSFTRKNHVWLDAPVLHGKRFSGTPHSRHHFVGD